MDNYQAASVLAEIAGLLDIEGESSFRVRAYERAAQAIRGLPQDINDLDKQGKLIEISGIGQGIADRLHELLSTGRMAYFEELKGRVPRTLGALVHIPGLGPKKAKLVYEKLGVETIEDLKDAVAHKKLRALPGMGAKTEANIVRGIGVLERSGARLLLNEAVPAAERVIDYLKAHPEVKEANPAGSLRRRRETIGDIDILCATEEPLVVADIFCSYPDVAHVIGKGDTKCSVRLENGLQVDIRLVRPDYYGAALQYFTGSKAHNIHIREIAKKKGLKVSEYGVFDIASGRIEASETEADVYGALGLEWIDPALRENRGEIEAAAVGGLPRLISLDDIHGDLHVHTRHSDGQSSVREMVEFARSLGYSYLAISDHAVELHIAGGLSKEEFARQWLEIDSLNRELTDFTVLRAVELNIDSSGKVDFPEEFLEKYDVATASIHTGFNQDIKQITDRMLTAIHNPHIDIIGHPTGRILGRRDPYNIDLGAVFKAAAETGTALELNAFPDRLDLGDEYLVEAKKAGCRFAVNTDAHHSGQLTYMRYGVDIARRGWLEAGDVINTFPLKKLRGHLKRTGERPGTP